MNKNTGILVTVITSLLCGCSALISCVWGVLIASGQSIDVTSNGITTQQSISPTIGFILLCLSVFMILVPIAVGFFTLRKKPEAPVDSVVPPTS